ncbi:MAG: homocysteine S-methyltransferase family protein [Candidatus Omnitrophica bacterium]|nr:homocysteine S-methyltransferase family protein [Candidatus Omnitrophota bacterium]
MKRKTKLSKLTKIDKLLKKRVLILDGAMGTQLHKHGMKTGVSPEIWALKNPEVIKRIHRDYCLAGADIIYTCTFGANRIKLREYGIHNVIEVNKKLAKLAKSAAGDKLVAGDIGPTGKFVAPFGPLDFEEAVDIFKEQARGLLQGGVDLFVVETMMDIQEARAALIAIREMTDKFVLVSLTYEKNERTLNGTGPITALITLQSLGANAFGCNCSSGPLQMIQLIKMMKPYAKIPLIAKPNAGMPKFSKGVTTFDMSAEIFGSFAKQFIRAGVNLLGGCCGTTPEHIRNLKKNIANSTGILPRRSHLSALSSAREHVILEGKRDIVKVGECINPTGKNPLQEELKKGKMSLVRSLAAQQQAAGAVILDVNAGVPGIDEKDTIEKMINVLSLGTKLPLVIDSADIDVMERALRLYPGRALINSISEEKHKLKKLLPVAAKYGAMCIVLPLNDREVPKTFKRRREIVLRIYKQAKRFGLTKSDLVIDGLIMTVSSYPQAGLQTLKTIRWAAHTFKVNTICGLSNISFGMPQRVLINSTYLSLLKKAGLSMVISNPMQQPAKYNKPAERVLMGKDKNAHSYISYYNKLGNKNNKSAGTMKEKILTPTEKVFNAVIKGDRDDIKEYVLDALDSKVGPDLLVHKVMIPAINKVGAMFEAKEYFLPQLIASAEAMKAAFVCLKPYLKKNKIRPHGKNIIILATVKGDIHDIGKNIVSLLLANHGFEVIDLGKDVGTKRIISEICRQKAPIVGLSALMTTTMVNMKEVIEAAKAKKLKCTFIIGGAVITSSFARSIGAEYASDGMAAVNLVKRLSLKTQCQLGNLQDAL